MFISNTSNSPFNFFDVETAESYIDKMVRLTNGMGVQVEDTKIAVVMVGLPARGKSFIAQKGEVTLSLSLSLAFLSSSSSHNPGNLD